MTGMDLTLSATLLPMPAPPVAPGGSAIAPGAEAFAAMVGRPVSADGSALLPSRDVRLAQGETLSAVPPGDPDVPVANKPAQALISEAGSALVLHQITPGTGKKEPARTGTGAAVAPVLLTLHAAEGGATIPALSAERPAPSPHVLPGLTMADGGVEPSMPAGSDEETLDEGPQSGVLPSDAPQPAMQMRSELRLPDLTPDRIGASEQVPTRGKANLQLVTPLAEPAGPQRPVAIAPADAPIEDIAPASDQPVWGTSPEAKNKTVDPAALPIQADGRGQHPAPLLSRAEGGAPLPGPSPVLQSSAPPVAHGVVQEAARHPEPRLSLNDALGERLGVTIARRVAEGGDEVLIRMDPAELGRIHVRLSFDEGGSLRAVVAAESPQLLDALRRDAPDLQRTLSDAGVRTDAQSFRFDRGSAGSDGGQSAGQWSQRAQRGWPGEAASDRGESTETYRPLHRSSRLDLTA